MTLRRLLWILLPLSFIVLCWVGLASHWGLAFAVRIASSAAPNKLVIESSQGSLLGPIKLSNVRYHDAQITVFIKQLQLDWQILALLTGKLKMLQLDLDQVNIDVHSQSTPQKESPPSINVVLPIAIDLKQANVHQLVVKTSNVSDPIVINEIMLSAYANLHKLQIRKGSIQAYKTLAKLNGQVELTKHLPLKLSVSYDYHTDSTRQLNGNGTLSGDLRQLKVNQSLTGMVQLDMRAEIKDVLTKMHWQTQLDIAHLNVQDIDAQGPPTRLSGKVSATGDLKALNLDSQLQVSDKRYGLMHIKLQGDSDLAVTEYHFNATGNYHGGDINGIDVPVADFSMNGTGTQQQVNLDHLSVQTDKGDMQGQAHINWQQKLSITSKLTLHQLQTEVISPQWPGKLSGELSLQTEQANGEQLYHFVARHITGKLRGYPLQGDVQGSWQENQLALKQVQLIVGGTKIKAQGKLAQRWNVAFEAHSNNLNSLLPEAKGKLDIKGQLTGTSKLPKINIRASAKQLRYAKESIGALQLNLNMGLAANTPIQFTAKADQVRSRAGLWTTLNLKGSGTTASHILTLNATSKDSNLHTRVRGKFEPWHWQGQLTSLDVQDKQFGKWHLKEAVAVSLAKNQYTLANLCLVSNASHLCAKGDWNIQKRQATLDGKTLPLALIQPWLPTNVKLSGNIDAQGTISLTTQDKVHASLALKSPDKSIKVNFTDLKEQLVFGESTITADQDDTGLHAVLHLPMSSGGGIVGNIKIPGWVPKKGFDKTQPVEATLSLENIPADFISRYIPNVSKVQGQFQANFQIGGSFGKPHVHGNIQWQGGSVLIAQLGISVHDIHAELKTSKTNTLAFALQAQSNSGDMRLEGETHLTPSEGWPTKATLSSHNLEVANIPEAKITINSDLHIKIKGNKINLEGDITVPRAQLKPKTIPEGTAQLSPDVVIVDAKKQTTQPSPWLISSSINVKLGDNVEFNGFGIKGYLNGKLQITDEPGKLTLGQGEINISQGTYLLQQKTPLKIRRGRLIFSNSFIDNPVVDVEAIRTVDVTVAGVRIKGTLKNPQLSLFSEPSMPDADILSYLFQGRALSQNTISQNQSNSNAALALGLVTGDFLQKDIGDRLRLDELRLEVNQTTQNAQIVLGKKYSLLGRPLHLRYTTDFTKSSQLVQFQWQISKHFQVQTESGIQDAQSVKGGDIFFTWNY